MDEEQLKEAAKEALVELQAIVLAKFAVFTPEEAVLVGLGEAFDLGYVMGHTAGHSSALTLAEAIMSEFKIERKTES